MALEGEPPLVQRMLLTTWGQELVDAVQADNGDGVEVRRYSRNQENVDSSVHAMRKAH